MKNNNSILYAPEKYAEAIKKHHFFFEWAYEIASKAVGQLPDSIVERFVKQYEARTGWVADIESTKAGIVDVLAAKILAKESDDSNITKWQHDLWSWHRLSEGWVYGPSKDKVAKTNPCLKHFDLLTEEEVSWDKMFEDLFNITIGTLYSVGCYIDDPSGEIDVLVDTFYFGSEENAREFMKGKADKYDHFRLGRI